MPLLACVESGFFKEELARSAYEYQKRIESEEQIQVGVNRFRIERRAA